MKANKSLLSALVGVALLAMPITASAHEHNYNRGNTPAYHAAPAFHGVAVPRANFRPQVAVNNRVWMRPIAPVAHYPVAPAYNPYAYNYGPNYYPAPYATNYVTPNCPLPSNYAAPYYSAPMAYGTSAYGAPMSNGLANMIRARDNAVIDYQRAVRASNHDAAHHLANDIAQLNKNIANARGRSGVGPAYGNFSMANSGYTTPYGYNSGLGSLVSPFLGFIR